MRIAVPTEWGMAVVHADAAWMPVRIEVPVADRSSQGGEVAIADARSDAATLCAKLQSYFAGEPVTWPKPERIGAWLAARGMHGFRLRAMVALAAVERGNCVTYGELARRAGSPRAARAAGSACAANPLPIVVPCHRVVPADGRVGSYSAGDGSPYKQRLWQLEASNHQAFTYTRERDL